MTDDSQIQVCDVTGCHGLNASTPPISLITPNINDASGTHDQPQTDKTTQSDNGIMAAAQNNSFLVIAVALAVLYLITKR
jgi:hypothetical protein